MTHPGASAREGFLYASCWGPQAGPQVLDPTSAGLQAQPVSNSGGRGSAWFVQSACGPAVLRHYRRGGLIGRLVKRHYVWQGAEGTRCVREYRLLQTLHDQGLPVPAPLAAGWWRSGPFYRQALMVAQVPGARTLAQLLRSPDAASIPWEAVGAVLARFHRAGVWHADLNAHNILQDGSGALWLIDFDRGTQSDDLPPAAAQANMARLHRSLRKLAGPAIEPGWQQLHTRWTTDMR